MVSRNKFKKARNLYCADALKTGNGMRMKRISFFEPKTRRENNDKKTIWNEILADQ